MIDLKTSQNSSERFLLSKISDTKTEVNEGIQRNLERLKKDREDITFLSAKLKEIEKNGDIESLKKDLDKFKTEFSQRLIELRSRHTGGGNANRNIAVGSNSSVLSRYTDINIKAGSNVTLTYTNNNTTKYLDLTIAATGGSGGTVRSINTISTSQTISSVVGTDYVYICSAGIQVTMPPDVATNTNLYTIKNTSTSSILVVPNGVETIDGATTLIMPIQYTAVDLISDTSGWNIT